MYYFGDLEFEDEFNPEETNMTNCKRCGFPCDRDKDAVCPNCGQTKKEDNYAKLKIQ